MHEIRWNSILKWWVMVLSKRQNRPLISESHCIFCPGAGKVPNDYEVLLYDNDWTILKPDHPEIKSKLLSSICNGGNSYGKFEVILYSPLHNNSLGYLSSHQFEKYVKIALFILNQI